MFEIAALVGEAFFVATFFRLSFEEPPNVRFYPQAILVLMGLCLVFSALKLFRERKDRSAKNGAHHANVLLAFALLSGYVAALNYLGYILGTSFFYFLWLCLFNRRFRFSYAAATLILTVGMVYVFGKLFSVPLPQGLFSL